MSLKQFHLFFIALSLGLSAFTARWTGQHIALGEDHGLRAILWLCTIGMAIGLASGYVGFAAFIVAVMLLPVPAFGQVDLSAFGFVHQ